MDGDVHALLKSHGDRFLAMFDDAEERPAIADQEAGSPSSEQDTPSTSESESGEDEAPQRWTGAADKVLPTPRQPQVKAAPQRPFVEDRERYKAERRAFMSGRIGGPRNTPQPGTQRRKPGAESAVDPRSRAEFAQIQRDVLDLAWLSRACGKSFAWPPPAALPAQRRKCETIVQPDHGAEPPPASHVGSGPASSPLPPPHLGCLQCSSHPHQLPLSLNFDLRNTCTAGCSLPHTMHVHPLPHLSTSATPNMSVEQVPLGWTRRHASSMKLFRSSAWVPRQKRGHGYQPASALAWQESGRSGRLGPPRRPSPPAC
ncbi:hypothetical protein ACKKBG_A03915 [Auxenochlorella protothecoides x Auxenochlorella symbiontica]